MIRAQYTEVLKNLLDDPIMKEKIDNAMSTYPLYVCTSDDPNIRSLIPTRDELNGKILNAYKYREIGFETVGRFIDELEISLVEIMPYYNQMFQTVQFLGEVDSPFDNVDMVESYEETRTSKSTGKIDNTTNTEGKDVVSGTSKAEAHNTDSVNTNTTNDENKKNVNAKTPQGSLDIAAKNIENVPYADEVNWDKSNNVSTSNSNGTNDTESQSESESTRNSENSATSNSQTEGMTEDTIKHTYTRKGNQGVTTYGHDIIKHRKAILNIEQEIIRDRRIRELFMNVL